jgi:hypothetical protein
MNPRVEEWGRGGWVGDVRSALLYQYSYFGGNLEIFRF